ncbi:dehydrogenase [Pseudoalteromonas porphyrae]|uniref:Dehydrogenase n=2 Tax=Pseudoalteromonas TaxID=53246 RepID=A0A0N0LXM5_9GAMM|nr:MULTISPECIES: SDR family NAD(P)-dependent oxidoreductase [Pseudoalteromonas]KPH60758.1 dehydrogenase [Pseudoalteromonas porphyrae]KPH93550.1 dehydrogenase [Pseudoalteromonas porphyrae]NNG43453.1 SDR family NAD(P)-dependent oxidoreductase [Pseudoalteromonas sp. NEC-BIFX-2020_002]
MNKTVLITGGTRGIGRALVKQYLAAGYSVYATGSNENSVAKSNLELPDVQWLVCNLMSVKSIENLASSIINRSFDVVIHNAAVQQKRDLFTANNELISIENETMINFTAPILLTRLLFSNVQKVAGTWVFITTGLAVSPKQSSPIYCANKAGIRAFCKSFNGQVTRHKSGITVCEAILPMVETDMTNGYGRGKISPAQAAREIIKGAAKGQKEIHVGKVRILMKVRALFPNLIENVMIKL